MHEMFSIRYYLRIIYVIFQVCEVSGYHFNFIYCGNCLLFHDAVDSIDEELIVNSKIVYVCHLRLTAQSLLLLNIFFLETIIGSTVNN